MEQMFRFDLMQVGTECIKTETYFDVYWMINYCVGTMYSV